MDYVKISEESLDEIMRKIRIENGMEKKDNIISTRNENIFTPETNDENYEMIDKYLNEAVIGKQIGLNIAPMKAKKGLALKVSRVIERIYLRVSQLITRDIRDFNSIIITLGHTIKRKLNIIDSNVKYLQDTVNKLNEEVVILKSMVCQLKDDNRSKFYSFEQILKENKERLKEYEIKFNNLAEEKIDNSIKEIDDKLSSTIKEIYEKKTK